MPSEPGAPGTGGTARSRGSHGRARRILRVLVLLIALATTTLVLAVLGTQTPWFKDWLRRYAIRQAAGVLNGELSIGYLSGDVFTGVTLTDVALRQQGTTVLAADRIEAHYDPRDFLARAIVLRHLALTRPTFVLVRTEAGWNFTQLVKRRPSRPDQPALTIDLPDVTVTGGTVVLQVPSQASSSGRVPERVTGLEAALRFRMAGTQTALAIERATFDTVNPSLQVRGLTTDVQLDGPELRRGNATLVTPASRMDIRATARDYRAPDGLDARIHAAPLSGGELARFVPALGAYVFEPALDVTVTGNARNLRLVGLVDDPAARLRFDAVADTSPDARRLRGVVDVERVDARRVRREWPEAAGHGRLEGEVSWPSGGSVAGQVALDATEIVAAGYRVDRLGAKVSIAGRDLQIDGRARAYGANASARGALNLAASSPPRYRFDGRVDSLNLTKLPRSLRVPSLESAIAGGYEVSGVGRDVRAHVIFAPSVIEAGRVANGAAADVAFEGGHAAYRFTGGVAGVDVPRFGRVLGIAALTDPRWPALLTGDVTLDGSGIGLSTMTLDVDARLHDSQVSGANVPAMTVSAHLAGGALQVRTTGHLEGLDPSRVIAQPRLAGLVNGDVDLQVVIPDLRAQIVPGGLSVDGQVHVRGSRVGEVTVDRLDADAAYAPDGVTLRTLAAEGPGLELNAHGFVALSDQRNSEATYHVIARDLEPIGRVAGVPLRGSAVADGAISGTRSTLRTDGSLTLNGFEYGSRFEALTIAGKYDARVPDLDPARTTAHTTLTGTLLRVAGRELRTADVALDYRDQQLRFDATLRDPQRTLSTQARLRFLPEGREILVDHLGLVLEGMEWRSVSEAPASIQWLPDRVTVQGLQLANGPQRVDVGGSVATGPGHEGEVRVDVTDVSVADLRRIAGNETPVEGRLNGSVAVRGAADARQVDADVRLDQGAVGGVPYESLTAKVVSQPPARLGIDAHLVQRPGAEISLTGTLPAPVALGGRQDAPGEMDLRVVSTPIDLALLQAASDELDKVTGQVRADLQVTGTMDAPQAHGAVDITGGAFAIKGTGQSYSGLDTSLRLDGDRVTIDRLRILDDDQHPMDVAGQIRLSGRSVSEAELTVRASGFEIIDTKIGDIEVDADLAVHGTALAPEVKGDVTLRSGRLELDQVLSQVSTAYATEATTTEGAREMSPADPAAVVPGPDRAPTIAASEPAGGAPRTGAAVDAREGPASQMPRVPPAAPAPANSDGLYRRAALDIHLKVPDNFVLRGNDVRMPGGRVSLGDLNVTLGGDVRLQKAAGADLVAIGTVETVRGTYDFQGRRFTVERDGRISFRGLDATNPDLDVTGTREISGILARVNVTGTARVPIIKLSSDPPLDEADVLSLIVFNAPANQLGEAQQGNLAERAGALASGFVVAPVAESLQRALDIDVFEVQAVGENGGGPSVTVGEQVGDRLFAQLRQQFGSQDVTEVLLEYRLADFLRLQGAFAEGQSRANRALTRRVERAGIDLVFVFSY